MAENMVSLKLRILDESILLSSDYEDILRSFMFSIGITSETAIIIFGLFLESYKKGIGLSPKEIYTILNERYNQKATYRNIHSWLDYFVRLGIISRDNRRYRFFGKPSEVFEKSFRELAGKSIEISKKLLKKLEE